LRLEAGDWQTEPVPLLQATSTLILFAFQIDYNVKNYRNIALINTR